MPRRLKIPVTQVSHIPVCGGEPCDAVIRGSFAFVDRHLFGLKGNGRSCADCHVPQDQFQLSPATVQARFKLLEWRRLWNPRADDPLFRAIDADDFRVNGEQAQDFSNLRENGLIRITQPLPPNIRLIDPLTDQPSNETSVDVWRSVPTVNDVKLTGPTNILAWPRAPNPGGGFQLDARIATLQEQALGALRNHAQVQNDPAPRLLDDLASFQRVLFSNPRVRKLSDAISAGVTPLPDPDPVLNELEQRARPSLPAPVRNATVGPTSPPHCECRCPSFAFTTSARRARARSTASRPRASALSLARPGWQGMRACTRSRCRMAPSCAAPALIPPAHCSPAW